MRSFVFIECAGASVISRGGRLYVRQQGECVEIESVVRVIVACGFGFVITSDAMRACVRRHIEVVITDASQSFTAIYASYAPGNASRSGLAVRARQFAAVADRNKSLKIAKDIVRRKIMTEKHERVMKERFLADLAACKSTVAVRHCEAKSAQEWWRRWRDFKLSFVKGFEPPKEWMTFKTRYIGREQGKVGELPKQFTPRFAQTPLQAMHNFVIGIATARMTRVIAARGLDPCFAYLHDGKKPGRFSLAWDAIEVLRPALATAVFDYAGACQFRQADFAQQDGVVRLFPHIAKDCAAAAVEAAPLVEMMQAVKKIEVML
jgi:CRISPR/Cas system-associated endonuclease Cas1